MRPESFDYRDNLSALVRQNVRFVVIGGVAMALHGSDHNTTDLDICYARDPANLEALVAALAPTHPGLRGAPVGLPFLWDARTLRNGLNFTLSTDFGSLDLMGEPAGVDSFDGLWNRATVFDIGGLVVRIASIGDLIAMKQAAGRPKDLNHVLELKAIQATHNNENE